MAGKIVHISDGILTETLAGTGVLVAATVAAAGATAYSLKKLNTDSTPRVAILAAAFFVASLVHFKVGVTSVHLVFNGLLGIILGWAAFPAILVGLFLQAIFFGHGGLSVLGVNVANFGFSGIISYLLFARMIRRADRKGHFKLGFLAGALAIVLNGALMMVEFLIAGKEFAFLGSAFFVAHLPVAVIEGIISGFAVSFLMQTKPEIMSLSGDKLSG